MPDISPANPIRAGGVLHIPAECSEEGIDKLPPKSDELVCPGETGIAPKLKPAKKIDYCIRGCCWRRHNASVLIISLTGIMNKMRYARLSRLHGREPDFADNTTGTDYAGTK
jgi:hypothetical protein